MRSENEMLDLIISTAKSDERILAVIMNGSRVNPHVDKDRFQDFDIVYVVEKVNSFRENPAWIDVFGERIIMQTPNDMAFPEPEPNGNPVYLMLFKDMNRIDLSLIPKAHFEKQKSQDSLSLVLLDKVGIVPELPPPGEKDYLPNKPTEPVFQGCCNEFWWVSTYIAKGLARGEITYAYAMFFNPVRMMFMTMLEWHMGIKYNYSINMGKEGKNLQKIVDRTTWERILMIYPDGEIDNIWDSLFLMGEMFREYAILVAGALNYTYNWEEDRNVSAYLKTVKSMDIH